MYCENILLLKEVNRYSIIIHVYVLFVCYYFENKTTEALSAVRFN